MSNGVIICASADMHEYLARLRQLRSESCASLLLNAVLSVSMLRHEGRQRSLLYNTFSYSYTRRLDIKRCLAAGRSGRDVAAAAAAAAGLQAEKAEALPLLQQQLPHPHKVGARPVDMRAAQHTIQMCHVRCMCGCTSCIERGQRMQRWHAHMVCLG